MSWRAFIIGLLAVVGFSLADPYLSFIKGYGWLGSTSFPSSAVFALVVLTLGVNVLILLFRRKWALSQAELMLVWCMVIVGATVPCEGVGRYWYGLVAGGPYMARRADLFWEDDGSLTLAPDGLVLSKDPRSAAARQYFEGTGGEGRIPWRVWARPLANWTLFLVLIGAAVFFLCAILRRQWVDVERLMFPLARVPLEFTGGGAGSGGSGLLPSAFTNKAFVLGVILTAGFRLLRALPLFFGRDAAFALAVPFADVFAGTPLQTADFENITLWIPAIGFAFLVPADVSLSVWFFYLFGRTELVVAQHLALPRSGGTWSPLMSWQQVGAYLSFVIGMVILARRHLWAVVRHALWLGKTDDRDEPIGYRLAFWGFVFSIAGCLAWYVYHGARLLTSMAALALLFSAFMVYARVVAQGGLYVSRTIWTMPDVLHGVSGGRVFTGPGAVIAQMQSRLLVTGSTSVLAPAVMTAMRISSVFRRHKRLLVPALMAAYLVAIPAGTYTSLRSAYSGGALNFTDTWGVSTVAADAFGGADRMIKQPHQSAEPYWRAMAFGGVLTAVVLFMRTRFYWWPIHPIGLLACSSWHANRLWLPFLLGWLLKVGIMKLSGGRLLRDARNFFIAVILVEAFTDAISALVRTLTDGAVPGF